MKRKVLLHLHGGSFARRYQIASHGITCAAAGDEVTVVLWFEALRLWVLGGFDDPTEGEEDRAIWARHRELGLPPPREMMEEARALGVKMAACETAVRLAGLDPAEAREKVDSLPGLQEIVSLAKDASLVLYV